MTDERPPKLKDDGHGKLATTVKPRSTEWLWHPYVPMKAITVVASAGGVGKGLVVADAVARVTSSGKWPVTDESTPLGNVIWAEAEDEIDSTVVPRLIAARADLERVKFYGTDDFDQVKQRFVREQNVRMIVLSPLLSFLGIKNHNHELEVREALESLQTKIQKTRCAIIGIMHPNKKADLAAIERLLGSSAFRNFCRSVIMLRPEDDETVRLVHGKWNLSIKGDDLLFSKINRRRTSDPRGQYIGINWEEADENINPNSVFDLRKEEDKSAGAWLKNYLRDGEWHELAKIAADAEPYSHTLAALRQAKLRNSRIKHKFEGKGRERTLWRMR